MTEDKLVAQERAALVAWVLRGGDKLCDKEVEELTGLSRRGMQTLMTKMARVLPIYKDDEGFWRRAEYG